MVKKIENSMHYTEFFSRLGMSRQTWRKWVKLGVMPAPIRFRSPLYVVWSEEYLVACQETMKKMKGGV